MPYFISLSERAVSPELTDFITKNHGIVLFPGSYLLPWRGTPDSLPGLIRRFVPNAGKIAIAAVTDYWALVG